MKKFVRNLACGLMPVFFAVSLTTCDWLDYPLDEYHAEQTGTLAVKPVRTAEGRVAVGTDGYVCVAPGTQTIVIPLDNPRGYAVREDGLIGFPAGLPSGVTATARQSIDKNAIEITVSGAAGDEFPLSLTVKTAKEGRLLAKQALNLACVDFETRLETLSVSWGTFSFNPDAADYVINNIPASAETISYTPKNSAATVSISGGLTVTGNTVTLAVGSNTVTLRVTAAHGAAERDYRLFLTRSPASGAKSITAFTIGDLTVTSSGNQYGVINEAAGTIGITVPYGTGLTSLTPVVTHTGVSYSPLGEQNFTNPVTYTVTAEDTGTKDYTVTVTAGPNTNADLTDLTVDQGTLSPAFSRDTTSYTVNVANSVSSITVTASKSDVHTKISIDGTDYNSGTTASKTTNGLAVGSNP
jgi:hypothetical protein